MASGSWNFFGIRLVLPEARAIRRVRRHRTVGISVGILVSTLLVLELRSSWVESRLLSAVDARATFSLAPGRDHVHRNWASGPYDQRLGYSKLPGFLDRLEARG